MRERAKMREKEERKKPQKWRKIENVNKERKGILKNAFDQNKTRLNILPSKRPLKTIRNCFRSHYVKGPAFFGFSDLNNATFAPRSAVAGLTRGTTLLGVEPPTLRLRAEAPTHSATASSSAKCPLNYNPPPTGTNESE